MSTYYGSVVVVNSTQQGLDSFSLIHECGPWRDELARPYLGAADRMNAPIKSETGHNDHWKLSFYRNGTHFHRDKQCNYEKKDEPQAVYIQLYEDSFSIEMPVSLSCMHNYYDKG